MSSPIQTECPYKFFAGDTVQFQIQNANYPSSLYSATFWFFASNVDPDSFAGTGQADGSFIFTINPSQTDTILPEEYNGVIVYTSLTGSPAPRYSVPQRTVWVIPDPTKQVSPSPAQQALTLLQTAYNGLAAGTLKSFDFSGVRYEKKNLAELQMAINVQQTQVNRENAQLQRLLGAPDSSQATIEFKWPGHQPGYDGAWMSPYRY